MRALVLSAMVVAAGLNAFEPPEEAVRHVLDEQLAAWNQGDLRRFVATYDEAAVFAGAAITKGRDQILARYLKRYPNREKMGRLSFHELGFRTLCPDYVSVTGKWTLLRSAENGGAAGGVFTLLLEHTAQGWKIVLDHSS